MNFRASFCDPLNPNIVDLGSIHKDSIIEQFERINWADYLLKMETVQESEIYFSPSLEIENASTKHGLAISAVGSPIQYEFYIFYKRPKKVTSFFGFKEKVDDNYTTEKTRQSKKDVLECLHALIKNDTDFLATKIGR